MLFSVLWCLVDHCYGTDGSTVLLGYVRVYTVADETFEISPSSHCSAILLVMCCTQEYSTIDILLQCVSCSCGAHARMCC